MENQISNLDGERLVTAIQYHEATKHHYHRYAISPGYLDWDNQPNPFRFYEGVTPIKLPFAKGDPDAVYMDLYERMRNPVREFSLENLSLFLELSLSISAWKSIPGAKWALRMNPSSGNLHPTESYVILSTHSAYDPGVYHYSPFLHALEPRASFSDELSVKIQRHFRTKGFLFAFTSIYWREAWKYGERAFRYSNHDIGHAIAAASFAANLLGWKLTYLYETSDEEIAKILGFHEIDWRDDEEEYPEVLFYVHSAEAKEIPAGLTPDIIQRILELSFQGRHNRLSKDHVDWEIIAHVAQATRKPRVAVDRPNNPNMPFSQLELSQLKATQIIRQRRSLLACDGVTSISQSAFLTMLDKTLPRDTAAPFDVGLGPVRVHLFLFVHRVKDLTSGFYMFVRDEKDLGALRLACRPDFLWEPVKKDFPLYLLAKGQFTGEATSVSCQQSIAGEGAFSLGMIAKFRSNLERLPFLYRHLFWETGMIGQVLYLEAEAHGVRSTGIGCFYDDPVHELLALRDNQFQSLYHFTVGGPVEDQRLQSWPPYSHLKENGGGEVAE
ncbi:MAG: SagB/ThcOx family dehydrogenase [Nitrospinae bacterium]|nr:SagB/ThcOx family dehydrogenase [Nitrospinota bacterium]